MTATTSPMAQAQSGSFEWRWGGQVFDVFTEDGVEAWTVEDGGRIRHRDAAGNWTFQTVPPTVKDRLHRIFFLPGPAGQRTGWAVGMGGVVLKTINSGSTWTLVQQFPAVIPGSDPHEQLYAVRFLDTDNGWILGLHGIWWTNDGGANWTPAALKMANGYPPTLAQLKKIELYQFDVVVDPEPPPGLLEYEIPIIGLASSEPGYVFRSTNGRDWQVVWDVLDHCAELEGTCAQVVCENDPWNPSEADAYFEAWDIQISRNPTQKLALMCGGYGFQCGLIYRSTDDGTTWVKEEHECFCATPPCVACTVEYGYSEGEAYPGDTTLYRLKMMRTMYNLAIFDSDNSAVAVGYNGQQLWREPSTGIWRDRSTHSENYLTATGAVVYPLTGVSTNGVGGSTGIAISTGMGGYVRRSIDGGQNWSDDLHGEPYRPQDVHFLSASDGWMAGQFSRIARTFFGGSTWQESGPFPAFKQPNLNAVIFADNSRGVAVGGLTPELLIQDQKPKLLYTLDNAANGPWNDSSAAVAYVDPMGTGKAPLRDVAFAPGSSQVWAAGDKGFVLRSQNNGISWRQIVNAGVQDTAFDMATVAFLDASTGLFAGIRAGVGTIQQLKINAGQFVWTDKSPGTVFGSHTVTEIAELRIAGSDAFAVGETTHTAGGSTIREGIVLHSTYSGGNFGPFVPFSSAGQFASCKVGYNLRDAAATLGPTSPVLRSLALISPGDFWIAGECGRVWHYASSVWTEHKSETDAHIRGISFPPGGSTGFFVGYRFYQTTQALVRYQ